MNENQTHTITEDMFSEEYFTTLPTSTTVEAPSARGATSAESQYSYEKSSVIKYKIIAIGLCITTAIVVFGTRGRDLKVNVVFGNCKLNVSLS